MGPGFRASVLLAVFLVISSCGGGKGFQNTREKDSKIKYATNQKPVSSDRKTKAAAKVRVYPQSVSVKRFVANGNAGKSETVPAGPGPTPPAAEKKNFEIPLEDTKEAGSLRAAIISGIKTGIYLFTWLNPVRSGLN